MFKVKTEDTSCINKHEDEGDDASEVDSIDHLLDGGPIFSTKAIKGIISVATSRATKKIEDSSKSGHLAPSNNKKHETTSYGSKVVNTLDKYLFPCQSSKRTANENRMVSNVGLLQLQSNNGRQQVGNKWMNRIKHHLQNTFHVPQFRGHQEEIINTTMLNQDVFVIMRTGGGKSLTYQLPAVIESESPQRKVTIVISPLISLIRDQEEQMNEMKTGSATSFTSGIGKTEHAQRWRLVRDPNAGIALIFVTPEKVSKSKKFLGEMEKLYDQGRLGRFVIDECHCACQWGHDFRTDYTKLGILKHHFPNIPVLAVTATASERVYHDCVNILRLGNKHRCFRSTANR